jgi:hypothetical protein
MEVRECKAVIREEELVKPRLRIIYPRVVGVTGYGGTWELQRTNAHIIKKVYQLIREQGYVQDPSKEMSGDYEIMLNKHCLLSIYFTNFTYTKGAAHGLTLAKGLTIDVLTGHLYQLKDLFRPNSGYRMRISNTIKKQIKEKDVPLIADFKGIDPEHQDFYLTDEGLVVFFQLYEYTPYAYGIPTFLIPYSELRDLAGELSPILRLFK